MKSSYEGKCREFDKAEENQHRLTTNPQSKATDIQKVGGWGEGDGEREMGRGRWERDGEREMGEGWGSAGLCTCMSVVSDVCEGLFDA